MIEEKVLSLQRINAFMSMDTKKIIQALAYIAYKEPGHMIDNIKAYKLMWLADRYHLRHTGRLVTGDSYFAMPKGPVPSDAKHLLEGQPTILANDANYMAAFLKPMGKQYQVVAEPDAKVFSISDREALDMAYSVFGGMDADELSTYSHDYPEWKAYEDKLKDADEKNSFPILIDLFFENNDVDDRGFFADIPEALQLAKEVYHESNRC